MADQTSFVVYFLSSDIQDLIDKGATDIKISGSTKKGKLQLNAEGINTNVKSLKKQAASSTRSAAAASGNIKFPCPMPCSTSQKS